MIIKPIFDNIDHIDQNHTIVSLPAQHFYDDFKHTIAFLKCYVGSEGTFNSYRRETERLLQWSWLIKKCSIQQLKRDDIEQFIRFCQNPPKNWISIKKTPRYINKDGIRQPNIEWRPFVATVSKYARQCGDTPNVDNFNLSQGAVKEIFAILSTFFNFLIAEEYLVTNPITLIRQKSKFVRKRQQHTPIRRLSLIQWQTLLDVTEQLAQKDPAKHERTKFILNLLFGMYLRISELIATDRWIPTMNDFHKDSNSQWWFTTVGKGNKERKIAVSDEMLSSLIRWRTSLNMTPLPSVNDNSPLIPKIRGTGPMCDTAPIRRLIQKCFDLAVDKLRQNNQQEEADNLATATVHWLRHTGISEDVKIRPREHVRDDAGHSSSATTDRYIDVEMQARHNSAKNKKISNIENIN